MTGAEMVVQNGGAFDATVIFGLIVVVVFVVGAILRKFSTYEGDE